MDSSKIGRWFILFKIFVRLRVKQYRTRKASVDTYSFITGKRFYTDVFLPLSQKELTMFPPPLIVF